jgi:YfiH family protein
MGQGGRLYLTPDWPAPARVRALCTVRQGGVSLAPYKSLNLGQRVGDDPAALAENLCRLTAQAALPEVPQWLHQVHGTTVADLDAQGSREADAAHTRTPGRVCAIQTADCLPVLFAACDGSVVGAAHAGWRGLAAGVLEDTLAALVASAAPGLTFLAWLGPAISPAHFEVGAEVRERFVSADPEAQIAFIENPRGRWQCDLYTLARRALARAGIADIFGGEHCSYAETSRFYSYRRDGQTGRMASLIWIDPAAQ